MSSSDTTIKTSSEGSASLKKVQNRPEETSLLYVDLLFDQLQLPQPRSISGSSNLQVEDEPSDYDIALAYSMAQAGRDTARIRSLTNVTITEEGEEDWETQSLPSFNEEEEDTVVHCPNFYLTGSLDWNSLETFLTNYLYSETSDTPTGDLKWIQFPHLTKGKDKITGRRLYCQSLARFWCLNFQLTLLIKKEEILKHTTYHSNPATIANSLGVPTDRLKRHFNCGIGWPYFLQLLCHHYSPTRFHCSSELEAEELGISTRQNNIPSKYFYIRKSYHPDQALTVVILPHQNAKQLLDNLSQLKQRFNVVHRAQRPNLASDAKLISIANKDPKKRDPSENSALDNYYRLAKLYNGHIAYQQIKAASLTKDKLKGWIKFLIPHRLLPGMIPMPKQMFSFLAERYGFITPSWLTIPAQHVRTASQLNELAFISIPPPYFVIQPPSKLMHIKRLKKLPDVQLTPTRLNPSENFLFQEDSDIKHSLSITDPGRTNLAPDYVLNLQTSEIFKHFQHFLRQETYTAQNSK